MKISLKSNLINNMIAGYHGRMDAFLDPEPWDLPVDRLVYDRPLVALLFEQVHSLL